MDDAKKAKRRAITAFFDDAEDRVVFLKKLAENGHEPEAITLSLVYMDRNAQALCWPSCSTGRNFVDALIEFGGEPIMGLVHPPLASRAFELLKPQWKAIAERISAAFPGPSYELISKSDFELAMAKYVTTAQLALLKPELWRATIANVVYQHLRNPAIHGVGTSGGIYLSATEWNGQPAPIIDFTTLRNCACGLIAEARRRSEHNCQWFGNDAIVGLA